MVSRDTLAFLLLAWVGLGGALPAGGVKTEVDEQSSLYDTSDASEDLKPTRVPTKTWHREHSGEHNSTTTKTRTETIVVVPTPDKKPSRKDYCTKKTRPSAPRPAANVQDEWWDGTQGDRAGDVQGGRTGSRTGGLQGDRTGGVQGGRAGSVQVDRAGSVQGGRVGGVQGGRVGGVQGEPVRPQGSPPALPRPAPPAPPRPSSSGGRPSGNSPSQASKKFGISYAPYGADHSCKSAEDIDDDFKHFASDYSVVRIYGTDCDQVPNVYASAKSAGVKLMLGIWDIHDVENEVSKIVSGLGGDWDIVHSISVGNELVNNDKANPREVVRAIRQARELLRSQGYEGPVVTVDTFIAAQEHPELCEESDYCAINAHAFFDSTIEAREAGKWLESTIEQVQSKLSKPMHIIITETGWPMDGAVNGRAVPGLENQKVAIDSIKETFADRAGDVMLFSAFNDLWKEKTMVTFDADQYWGIGGAISRVDL